MSKIVLISDVTLPENATYAEIIEADRNLAYHLVSVPWWDVVKMTFCAPEEAIATRMRLRLTMLATYPRCELAASVTQSLAGKSYTDQKAVIEKAINAVACCRICGENEPIAYSLLPHGSDATTDQILAEKDLKKVQGFTTSDKAAFDAGKTAEEWLWEMKDQLDVFSVTEDPMMVHLDSSISGNGAWWDALNNFIAYAKLKGATFTLVKDI